MDPWQRLKLLQVATITYLQLSTINIKTPPPPCNVVFNLKAPLGNEKPNQTIPARFSSLFSDNGV